mgnify:FL=1
MNQHLSKRKALKEAIPYLECFGLGEYSNKPPYAMSGGMRQRASFVRTILTGKDILLFDEPFGARAADVFLETERKVFRMSGPEERERAVGLYSTTPMTTAQVGEAPGLSDQAVPGTPVGEGSQVCRSYGGTHHPAGDKGQGDRTGAGRRKRAAERLGAGVGAVHDRAGAYGVEWPRCGPGTGTPARPTSQRHGEAGTPEPSAMTRRRRVAGSRSRGRRTR